jgi:hypothetical protein
LRWREAATFAALAVAAVKDGKPEHTAITVPMFQPGSEDTRKLLGDATDCGLLRYCDHLVPSSLVRMAYKKVRRVGFQLLLSLSLLAAHAVFATMQYDLLCTGPQHTLWEAIHA